MSQTYKQWCAKVDALLHAKVGVGMNDLADGPSRDAYDDGLTPRDYAFGTLPEYDDLLGSFLSGGF
jgi:hypothetical protein